MLFDIFWFIGASAPWLFQTPQNGLYEDLKLWRFIGWISMAVTFVSKVYY